MVLKRFDKTRKNVLILKFFIMGWPEKFNLGIQPKMNSNQFRIYKSMGQPPGSNNRDCFQSKDWSRVLFYLI